MLFTMPTLSLIAMALLIIRPVSAKASGINCEGNCAKDNAVQVFYDLTPKLNQGRRYWNGEHFMCMSTYSYDRPNNNEYLDGGYCLFLEKESDGLLGKDARFLLEKLREHGCNNCGAIPTDFHYPDRNELKYGALKIDRVGRDKIQGCEMPKHGQARIC
jgi:hypothetical protein